MLVSMAQSVEAAADMDILMRLRQTRARLTPAEVELRQVARCLQLPPE